MNLVVPEEKEIQNSLLWIPSSEFVDLSRNAPFSVSK
jgi:hypothetical protein